MRFAFGALLLAGCFIQPDTGSDDYPPPPSGGWGSGWGGSDGTSGYGCQLDSQCPGASVCARDGSCMSASSVRIVHVMWTLKGQDANATSCSAAPKLDITFTDSYSATFGFSPVPCDAGKFTVDKL